MMAPSVRFSYFILNMDYTMASWNADPQNRWLRVAHEIAQVTLVPFLLIASTEALVKNGYFLIANLCIALANTVHGAIYSPATA